MARWVEAAAQSHDGIVVDLVDLAEVDLPLLDEPQHPRLRRYTQPHTKAWSERIDAADAFVFVLAEYNHGYTAAVKNAVDYLHHEWSSKPAAIVSYGGVSAGTRALAAFRPVLVAVKAVPIPEAVNIPFVSRHLHEGRFVPEEVQEVAAEEMLNELLRWAEILAPDRVSLQSSPTAPAPPPA